MKFLIQKSGEDMDHEFSRTLLEAIKYHKWADKDCKMSVVFDSKVDGHNNCIPIGSVEFVQDYLKKHHDLEVKPINIPEELMDEKFTGRKVFNGTRESIECNFVKSMDKIKGFTDIVSCNNAVPEGNYQISDIIEIDSEWRAFIYKGVLVGLQNYCGDFTSFPSIKLIKEAINEYTEAPIAYTLDIGITYWKDTVVIEVHDFFSVGLYGFSDYRKLPFMYSRWFGEYVAKNKYN